ncbi:hypothetical protein LEP1GSC024_1483 [Leptospira noguchii str. 2001034031]|uniref:Uncharacterized protein n=1 Tax=Leptospira noguchii str. 2001034031 TaxID=1193053 RepID=M6YFN4_9LEPT|nr:hypothetical protein LEP1GSC024_1483 [Leptospira noguchii str. 2001034031]
MLKIWFNMDLALLSTRSFSFFPPYAELTLSKNHFLDFLV